MRSEYIVLSCVAALVAFILWLPRKQLKKEAGQKLALEDSPVAFGYKCMWFAIKTDDTSKAAEALNLQNAVPCNWANGIDEAYKTSVYIAPAINGWVLAVGLSLPHQGTNESYDEITGLANKLSERFGEAQFFCTHWIVEYHCWLKSVNGKIERLYSYLGESGENLKIKGKPTPAEQKYNLVNTFSDDAKNENYFEREDLVVPDEELVMEIAGEWSVNPTTLEDRKNIRGLGILGNLKRQ